MSFFLTDFGTSDQPVFVAFWPGKKAIWRFTDEFIQKYAGLTGEWRCNRQEDCEA